MICQMDSCPRNSKKGSSSKTTSAEPALSPNTTTNNNNNETTQGAQAQQSITVNTVEPMDFQTIPDTGLRESQNSNSIIDNKDNNVKVKDSLDNDVTMTSLDEMSSNSTTTATSNNTSNTNFEDYVRRALECQLRLLKEQIGI